MRHQAPGLIKLPEGFLKGHEHAVKVKPPPLLIDDFVELSLRAGKGAGDVRLHTFRSEC